MLSYLRMIQNLRKEINSLKKERTKTKNLQEKEAINHLINELEQLFSTFEEKVLPFINAQDNVTRKIIYDYYFNCRTFEASVGLNTKECKHTCDAYRKNIIRNCRNWDLNN